MQFFGHLPCLVLSELPGSMIWYLTLIWGNSQSLLFQLFLVFFSFFSFWNSHYTCITPSVVVPQLLDILFCFFSLFFSLPFSFGGFYLAIFKLRDSFLRHIQSTNKPNQRYSSFLLQCFWSLAFLFGFFLEFPHSANIAHLFLSATYFIHYSP